MDSFLSSLFSESRFCTLGITCFELSSFSLILPREYRHHVDFLADRFIELSLWRSLDFFLCLRFGELIIVQNGNILKSTYLWSKLVFVFIRSFCKFLERGMLEFLGLSALSILFSFSSDLKGVLFSPKFYNKKIILLFC